MGLLDQLLEKSADEPALAPGQAADLLVADLHRAPPVPLPFPGPYTVSRDPWNGDKRYEFDAPEPVTPEVISEGGVSTRAPLQPPGQPPATCKACGTEFWWQGVGDRPGDALNCCECHGIISRSLVARFWAVVLAAGKPTWRRYEPDRWDPYAAIDASRNQQVKKQNAGF